MLEVPISAVIGVVAALAAAIGVLFRQNQKQQEQVALLLAETKQLMGGLSELVRSCNALMIEVKDAMKACTGNRTHGQ